MRVAPACSLPIAAPSPRGRSQGGHGAGTPLSAGTGGCGSAPLPPGWLVEMRASSRAQNKQHFFLQLEGEAELKIKRDHICQPDG